MNYEIIYGILSVFAFVPAIVLHEVAHGFAAYKLGDPTAKSAGRLTLNPLKHVDPFGTVLMPLMLLLLNWPVFGYAKPVPYNPRFFKDPRKGDLIVGLAGPAANLAMALVGSAILYALAPFARPMLLSSFAFYLFMMFLVSFVSINLYLMFFNLIPIPPLDGSSILAVLIPPQHLPKYYQIQRYAMPFFMLLVLVVPYMFNVNPVGWFLRMTAGSLLGILIPTF